MEVWGGSSAFEGAVSVPGNDVTVSCVPVEGNAAGGDIYYVSNCAAGLITRFVLADVAGHGSKVAALADRLRQLMRRNINNANQTVFAEALNREFAELSTDGRFATAVLLTYFAPTDHLIICNAGHPRPLFKREATGRWERLDFATPGVLGSGVSRSVGIANLPLGVLHPSEYEQFAVKLEPGDQVIAYSDALMEAKNGAGQQLGEDALLELVNRLDAGQDDSIVARLRAAVREYANGRPLDDDATLIWLHHNGANPPRMSWRDRAAYLRHALGIGGIDSAPRGSTPFSSDV